MRLPDPTGEYLTDEWPQAKVTLSHEGPASIAAAELAFQAGVSVVVGAQYAETVVTLELDNVTVEHAFKAVAESLEVEARYEAGVVSFSKLGAQSWSVVPLGFIAPTVAEALFRGGPTSTITATIVGSRAFLRGPTDEVLQAVSISREARRVPDGWRIDVWVIECTGGATARAGLDVKSAGEAAAAANAGVGHFEGLVPVLGARVVGSVSAAWEWLRNVSDAHLSQHSTLYLLEGGMSQMNVGDSIPVPRRTVSPEGTVTTNGYDVITTGFTLLVQGRTVDGGCLLKCEPEIASVVGFVEEFPRTRRSRSSVESLVPNGGVLMLSGLVSWSDTRETRGLGGGFSSRDERGAELVVLLRATRVYTSSGVETAR